MQTNFLRRIEHTKSNPEPNMSRYQLFSDKGTDFESPKTRLNRNNAFSDPKQNKTETPDDHPIRENYRFERTECIDLYHDFVIQRRSTAKDETPEEADE